MNATNRDIIVIIFCREDSRRVEKRRERGPLLATLLGCMAVKSITRAVLTLDADDEMCGNYTKAAAEKIFGK